MVDGTKQNVFIDLQTSHGTKGTKKLLFCGGGGSYTGYFLHFRLGQLVVHLRGMEVYTDKNGEIEIMLLTHTNATVTTVSIGFSYQYCVVALDILSIPRNKIGRGGSNSVDQCFSLLLMCCLDVSLFLTAIRTYVRTLSHVLFSFYSSQLR